MEKVFMLKEISWTSSKIIGIYTSYEKAWMAKKHIESKTITANYEITEWKLNTLSP